MTPKLNLFGAVKRFGIIHPLCLAFGHDFVTEYGKTYCITCGKVVK